MTSKKELQTILVIVGGLILMYFIFKNYFILFTALVIGLVSILSPFIRRIIIRLWLQFAKILGFINTRILLSIVFFLILFPIAVLNRFFSKDKFQLKKNKSRKSYYIKRFHEFTADDFKNPW